MPKAIHIPTAVRKQLESGKRDVKVVVKRRSQVRFAYANPIAALRRFVEGR